jgi:hypothetical protein
MPLWSPRLAGRGNGLGRSAAGAAGEARRDHQVAGREFGDRGVPESEQAGVDAGAQQVEDVFHARLPVRPEAPQVGPSDHDGLRGLHLAFTFAAIATFIAVIASAIRGRRYQHATEPVFEELAEGTAETALLADERVLLPGGIGSAAARNGSAARTGHGAPPARPQVDGKQAAQAGSGAETGLGSSSGGDLSQ